MGFEVDPQNLKKVTLLLCRLNLVQKETMWPLMSVFPWNMDTMGLIGRGTHLQNKAHFTHVPGKTNKTKHAFDYVVTLNLINDSGILVTSFQV